jgi:MFS family permease
VMNNRCLMFGVIYGSVRMLVGGVSALYILSTGMSLAELGALKTLQAIVLLFVDLPFGILADRYGRRPVVLLAVFASAAWLLITGIATEKWHIYLGEVFNSLAIGLYGGAYTAYLIADAKKTNPQANIKTTLAMSSYYLHIGMAIAAIVGSLVGAPSSSTVWLIASFLTLLCGIIGYVLLPIEAAPGNTENISINAQTQVQSINQTGAVKLLGPKMLVSGFALLCVSAYYQVLIQFWQPLISVALPAETGVWFGVMFAAILLVQAWASLLVGKKLFILNHPWSLPSVFALGAGGLLFGLAYTPPMIVLSTILLFFCVRFWLVKMHAELHENLPEGVRATFDSSLSTITRAILMALMPIVGALIDFGGMPILAWLALVVVAFSSVASWFSRRKGGAQ